VGVLSGVPRDRVPRPPRGGRARARGWKGEGKFALSCFFAGRDVSVLVSVSVSGSVICGPMGVCVCVVCTVHNKLFLIEALHPASCASEICLRWIRTRWARSSYDPDGPNAATKPQQDGLRPNSPASVHPQETEIKSRSEIRSAK
jgi:hypothetical protein